VYIQKPMAIQFAAKTRKRRDKGGRPRSDDPKVAISIRLDRDVLERWKASGKGWQSRINDALKSALEA